MAHLIQHFDPAARAAEKQADRDADARALASGEKSREQLWQENSCLPIEAIRAANLDYSGMAF